MPGDESQVEKRVWDERDFPNMNWHFSWVHGMARLNRGTSAKPRDAVVFDLDYVFQEPRVYAPHMEPYLVAPVTLVFEDVTQVEVYMRGWDPGFELTGIARYPLTDDAGPQLGRRWLWNLRFSGSRGAVWFEGGGFTQCLRRAPVLRVWPRLGLEDEERGGLSFDCPAADDRSRRD